MRDKNWWKISWERSRDTWLHGETYGKGNKDIGGDEEFEKYWEEGKQAFLKCLDPEAQDNPYSDFTDYRQAWRLPWFGGFRTTCTDYFNEKYKILELQSKIRALILSHGLKIEREPEYNTPYAKTPEGFVIVIADDNEVEL
jgi:hypothetical protein